MKIEQVEMSKTGDRVLDGPGPLCGLGKPEPGNTAIIIRFGYQSGLLVHVTYHIYNLLAGLPPPVS